MDKETLSKYGWVVIVVIIILILIGFASPFGSYASDWFMGITKDFTSKMGIEIEDDTEVITNYTPEEIEADEHLYAIGKTKPEYVVVKFNNNYTEAIITKNGEDSDGIMNRLSGSYVISNRPVCNSPMTEHSSTLKTVYIKKGVTSIGQSAFENCENIAKVTLPNSLITIDSKAFAGCKSLKDITIPNNVTSIGNSINGFTFENCLNLENVKIGDSVTFIGTYSFAGCSNLTNITIPSSVEKIRSYAFEDCVNLKNMYYKGTANDWVKITFESYSSNPMEYAKNEYFKGELVKDIILSKGITDIKNHAFRNCDSLQNVTIPDSVISIGLSAFYKCTNLQNIIIPDSVTSIGNYAFRDCSSLQSIIIPDKITSISKGTFYYCTGLQNITIPDSITSINKDAFYNCTSLQDMYYTGTADDWVKISFSNFMANPMCYAKNEYFKGELVTDIVLLKDVTNIKEYAFYNCDNLRSIVISENTTSIDYDAFGSCNNLQSITIPNSIIEINGNIFSYCYQSITIYGEADSYAETWANEKGYTFVAI